MELLSLDFLAPALAIAFLAAVAQGITGFGFGLVLVPLLSAVYDPKAVVVVSLTLGFLTKLPMLVYDRRFVQWRMIAPLVLAAFVGNAVGTRVILYADPAVLRLIIGATVVVLATLLLRDYRWRIRRERLATIAVGLTSGVLTGSTSMGGPPVVLFGVNQLWAKESLRANLVAFSTLTFLFSAVLLATSGVVTREIASIDLALLPAVAVGLVIGNHAFQRAPRALLYRAVVLFVLVTGLYGIYSSAAGLLAGGV